jgi:hypothetical protein
MKVIRYLIILILIIILMIIFREPIDIMIKSFNDSSVKWNLLQNN